MPIEIDPVTGAPIITPKDTTSAGPPVADPTGDSKPDGDSTKSDATVDASSVADLLHDKIMAILAEYNNVEADIPYGHEYWQLRNQMLAFRR